MDGLYGDLNAHLLLDLVFEDERLTGEQFPTFFGNTGRVVEYDIVKFETVYRSS